MYIMYNLHDVEYLYGIEYQLSKYVSTEFVLMSLNRTNFCTTITPGHTKWLLIIAKPQAL